MSHKEVSAVVGQWAEAKSRTCAVKFHDPVVEVDIEGLPNQTFYAEATTSDEMIKRLDEVYLVYGNAQVYKAIADMKGFGWNGEAGTLAMVDEVRSVPISAGSRFALWTNTGDGRVRLKNIVDGKRVAVTLEEFEGAFIRIN